MKCCGGCFRDRFLRNEIEHRSKENGQCEFCGANATAIIETNELTDMFDLVCGIYEEAEDGQRLADWLIEDWEMFSLAPAQAQSLLVEILNDGERPRKTFRPSPDCDTDRLATWQRLREELRGQNRFFPITEFNEARVENLLSNLIMPIEDLPKSWYRARIEEDGGAIPLNEMGAPPPNKASAGRANPVGIPYLYIGSESKTAITETRPHPGEGLSIATFSLVEDIKLIDLRHPRKLITPFSMEDTLQVAALRGDIDFLERLGEELKTPVLPNAAAIDYIPSQYLCEFIKKSNYDGVVYGSSVSDGMNLALFDPDNAQPGTVSRVHIDRVDVTFNSVP